MTDVSVIERAIYLEVLFAMEQENKVAGTLERQALATIRTSRILDIVKNSDTSLREVVKEIPLSTILEECSKIQERDVSKDIDSRDRPEWADCPAFKNVWCHAPWSCTQPCIGRR